MTPAHMARREADREDIMREAVALKRRVSFAVPGTADLVVCGVRANGYWSFYLDPDRVYQFDDQFRLRRAYVAGHLYRTQGDTLARMHRERSEAETVLQRVDLNSVELVAFLNEADFALARLLSQIQSGEARVVESIPRDADVLSELRSALERLVGSNLDLSPAIAGKR